MSIYQIKKTVDRLASVCHIVTSIDHLEAIFNGLPKEYDTFGISVNSRSNTYTVEEIESLLLSQESRIERRAKDLDTNPMLTNFISHNNSNNTRETNQDSTIKPLTLSLSINKVTTEEDITNSMKETIEEDLEIGIPATIGLKPTLAGLNVNSMKNLVR